MPEHLESSLQIRRYKTSDSSEHSSARFFVVVALFASIGLLGKLPLLGAQTHLPAALLLPGVLIAVCVPTVWKAALRRRKVVAPIVSVLLVSTLFFGYASMQRLHRQGRGSDQADCVIVGAQQLAAGQWPYQPAKIWTGNAMSCGPGWIALQTPMTALIGYPANLLAIWVISLGVVIWVAGWETAFGVLALLALVPVFWLALFDGSDFLSFGILSAAILALAEHRARLGRARIPWIIAVSLIDQFRVPTLVLPVLLRRALGRTAVLIAVVLGLLWQVGFLYWNAEAFTTDGPWHLLRKIRSLHLMPGAGLSMHPLTASLQIAVPLLLTAFILMSATKRYSARALNLIAYAILFGVPALFDIAKKYGLEHNAVRTLQTWEGGLWLCALLPVLAYCIVVPAPPDTGFTS